jgi:ABC-type phosphate transport system auxiliary subunit
MHFFHTFFTNFRAGKEKLIINFSAKEKKQQADLLKIKQERKRLTNNLDNKFVTLRALESSLQNDKASLLTIEIQSIRYEIQKIKFEIIEIKEQIGALNEAEEQIEEQQL